MFLKEYTFSAKVNLPNTSTYEKKVVLQTDKGLNHAVKLAKHEVMKERNLSYQELKYIRIELNSMQIITR